MTDAINREDVIRIAKESGFKACVGTTDKEGNYHPFVNALGKDIPIEWLERFAALAALRARPAGWIDASKQMPPPQLRVIGFEPQYNIVNVDTWFGPDFQWAYSYWMPLPPPPGQEQPDMGNPITAQPDHSELVKNAARYRWLREQHWSDSKFAVVSNPKTAVNLGSICPSRELLDEAIDAAIGETME